jgi:hypothetical protein
VEHLALSLSHDGDIAAAVVVAVPTHLSIHLQGPRVR